MEYYKLDKLVKIQISDFIASERYMFLPKIKFFGITFKKEGIFFIGGISIKRAIKDFNKDNIYVIKDNVVFVRPRVILFYVGGFKKSYFFDSIDGANEFAEGVKNSLGYSHQFIS